MLLGTIIFTALVHFIQCDVKDVEALREKQEARLKPLYKRHQDLDGDIYNFKTHCYARVPRIARNSFDSIAGQLLDNLNNQLPSCSNLDIWRIKQDLQNMVTSKKPYVCEEELDFISDVTDNLWNSLDRNVTSLINIMKTCTEAEYTCTFEEEFDKAESMINALNDTLRAYKNVGLEENWTAVKNCYDNLVNRIQKRMSEVHLAAKECENITDYQEILERVSLWPLTVDKFVLEDKSQIPEHCPDVAQLSVDLESDILDAKSWVRDMMKESSERFSKDFQNTLKTHAKNNTQACYKDSIKSYQNILSSIESNEEQICIEDLTLVNSTLTRMMFASLVKVQPLIYDVTSCQQQNETCKNCNHLLNQTLTEIDALRQKLLEYDPEYLLVPVKKMNACFLMLKQKLAAKLIDIEKCESKSQDSVNAQFTLDELLSEQDRRELESIEVKDSNDEFSNQEEVHITGLERNQKLLERLMNISDTFQDYTERLKPEINFIVEDTYFNLYSSIDSAASILKRGLSGKDERQNFAEQLNKFHQDVNKYYHTKVQHICSRPLPELIENMTKIYEDEVPKLIEKLKTSPNCDPNEPCVEAAEYLIDRLDVLSRIQEFDLPKAKIHVETCLGEAKERLCAVLERSEILGMKKSINFSKAFEFKSLPKEMYYPSTYTASEEKLGPVHYFTDVKSLLKANGKSFS